MHAPEIKTVPLLAPSLSQLTLELASRLEGQQYSPRKASSTRREDGAVQIDHAENQTISSIVVRLNAYQEGLSAVLKMTARADQLELSSLMLRPGFFGGDDRSLVAIPQSPTARDLPLIENMIYAACTCVQRGQIRNEPMDPFYARSSTFHLFLPADPQLARFSSDFSVLGLPSLY